MKEIELTIKARNNRLKARRLALHMTIKELAKASGINHQLYQGLEVLRYSPRLKKGACRVPGCKGMGWSRNLYVCDECMDIYGRDPEGWPLEMWPLKPGVWRDAALHLARFHKCEPSELFPEGVLRVHRNQSVIGVDTSDMQQMLEAIRYCPPVSLLQAATPPDVLLEEKETREELTSVMQVLNSAQLRAVQAYFVNDLPLKEIAEQERVSSETIDNRIVKALHRLRHPNQSIRIKQALGKMTYESPDEVKRQIEKARADAEARKKEAEEEARAKWEVMEREQEAKREKLRIRNREIRQEYEALLQKPEMRKLAERAIKLSERYQGLAAGVSMYRAELRKLAEKHDVPFETVVTVIKIKLRICLYVGCTQLLHPDQAFCVGHLIYHSGQV